MRNLLDYDESGEILTTLRITPDRRLQAHIVTLLDLRNHATGWMAEQWNDLLCLACQVRDERRAMAAEVDDAMNPFRVVGETSSSGEVRYDGVE